MARAAATRWGSRTARARVARAGRHAERERTRLQRELERVKRERDRLRHENDRLKEELDLARRVGKRQAAPFSKGPLTPTPRRAGRRPCSWPWACAIVVTPDISRHGAAIARGRVLTQMLDRPGPLPTMRRFAAPYRRTARPAQLPVRPDRRGHQLAGRTGPPPGGREPQGLRRQSLGPGGEHATSAHERHPDRPTTRPQRR